MKRAFRISITFLCVLAIFVSPCASAASRELLSTLARTVETADEYRAYYNGNIVGSWVSPDGEIHAYKETEGEIEHYLWQTYNSEPSVETIEHLNYTTTDRYFTALIPGLDTACTLYRNLDDGQHILAKALPGVEGAEEITLDLVSGLDLDDPYPWIQYSAINDETLAMLIMSFDAGMLQLAMADLETGECEFVDIDPVEYGDPTCLCAGPDDSFIFGSSDYNDQCFNFVLIDSYGDMTELFSYDGQYWPEICTVAYVPEENSVYFIKMNELYRCRLDDTSVPEYVDSFGAFEGWGGSSLYKLSENIFVASNSEALCITGDILGDTEAVTLTVAGSLWDDTGVYQLAANELSQLYPSLAYAPEEYASTDDIINAITTRSSAVDIYFLSAASEAYKSLMNRGFMAELDTNEGISSAVSRMYPEIQKAITNDDTIAAIPIEAYTGMYFYNPAAFMDIGLTESDIPATWADFFRLLQRMPELIEDSGYAALDSHRDAAAVRRIVFYNMLESYESYMRSTSDSPIKFDTPILREAIGEFEKIDFDALYVDDETLMEMPYGRDGVVFKYQQGMFNAGFVPGNMCDLMPLSFEKDAPPIINGSLNVAFVNPYSENADLAIKYLELVVEHQTPQLMANLYTDWTEPVRDETLVPSLEELAQEIEGLKTAMESCKNDEEKEAYMAAINDTTSTYDHFNAISWIVSEHGLATYKANSENIYYACSLPIHTQLDDIVRKYTDGAIDADAFIKEMDSKVYMMLMEE